MTAALSPEALVRARCMMAVYHARHWAETTEELEVLAVECEFTAPLTNPDTGATSRTWQRAGKFDALVRTRRGGTVLVVEHKTSSDDITPGSDYWTALTLDGQVSGYLEGARALGYEVAGCLYDVLGKPSHRRLLATPPESRKYTQEKRDRLGNVVEPSRLYAGQRDDDETLDAYEDRLLGAMCVDPQRYAVRGTVVRIGDETTEAAADDWATGRAVRDAELADRWPRNPDACRRYGRLCSYWPICAGQAAADDSRFTRTRPHRELPLLPTEGRFLTASSMRTFRRCQREYRHRYVTGIVPAGEEAESLTFGTAVHAALEVWWLAVRDGSPPDVALADALSALDHTTRNEKETAA